MKRCDLIQSLRHWYRPEELRMVNVWFSNINVLAETHNRETGSQALAVFAHMSDIWSLKLKAQTEGYLSGWWTAGSKFHRLVPPQRLVQSATNTHRSPENRQNTSAGQNTTSQLITHPHLSLLSNSSFKSN